MIDWFTRRPGDDVAIGSDDPTMLLVGGGHPDWVRAPSDMGGMRLRVLKVRVAQCPRGDHEVKHMDLEDDVSVAECRSHGGFLWYRTKP